MGKAFEEIQTGLQEALLHAKGGKTNIVEHKPTTIDVKKIRKNLGMSQQKFCASFGISLGTLRHWEQGDRTPKGPALVLLKVVEKSPQAVIEAVAS